MVETRRTRPSSRKHPEDGHGALLFARYAYAPNERGTCGPADHLEVLEYGANGVADGGLAQLAAAFHGAWPYLELIAGATGIADPLDSRVVEAYWVGNGLLDRVDRTLFAESVRQRFSARAGPRWPELAETVTAGGVPHHSYHVLCVYPWIGLLEEKERGQPLEILDRCRIRWGRVVAVVGDQAVVRSRPLRWDGYRLVLAPFETETVRAAASGRGFVTGLQPGEWVALHWQWVCDRLSPRQLAQLRSHTARTLAMTNERVTRPGPALTLSA